MVQWLRPCTSTAGVKGSMPVGRTKIPHVVWYGKKFGMNTFKKKKRIVDLTSTFGINGKSDIVDIFQTLVGKKKTSFLKSSCH